MPKLFQNKSLSKSIRIFLVCLVVLGGKIILLTALSASAAGHGHYFKYDKDIVLVLTEGSEFLLKIAGGLALLVIILGGVYYMVMGSNPDGQTKAKKIITYAVIGLAIALVSYVIIAAVESIGV